MNRVVSALAGSLGKALYVGGASIASTEKINWWGIIYSEKAQWVKRYKLWQGFLRTHKKRSTSGGQIESLKVCHGGFGFGLGFLSIEKAKVKEKTIFIKD